MYEHVEPAAVPPAAPARSRRWPKALAVLGLAVGIAAGSAATSVWATHQFSDVPGTSPFHGDVDWLVGNGITTGYEDGTFRPQAPVSRQAMAAFLHRFSNEIEVVESSSTMNGRIGSLTTHCPEGKRPIAGGGGSTLGNLFLTDSNPDGTGWRVRWESDNDTIVQATLRVWVTCVPGQ